MLPTLEIKPTHTHLAVLTQVLSTANSSRRGAVRDTWMKTAPKEVLVRFILSEEERTPAAEQVVWCAPPQSASMVMHACLYTSLAMVISHHRSLSVSHTSLVHGPCTARSPAPNQHNISTYL